MIAVVDDAVWVRFAGLVIAGILTLVGVIYQSRKTRSKLDTGNGHTAGQGIARVEKYLEKLDLQVNRMEDRQLRTEKSMDRAEVRQDETADLTAHAVGRLNDIDDKLEAHSRVHDEAQPMRDWLARQIEKEENDG